MSGSLLQHIDKMTTQEKAGYLGSLETAGDLAGTPYVSLVLFAPEKTSNGTISSFLLHLSALARHTRNIQQSPQVSLLLDGTHKHSSRLEGPRACFLGKISGPLETIPEREALYLRYHPDAEISLHLPDFHFYSFFPREVHLIAGFGQIKTLKWPPENL